MKIQLNSTTVMNRLMYTNKETSQVSLPSNEATIKALSQDTFEFNYGPEPFVTYDSKGFPNGYHVKGVDISGGKPMTDDEKWAAIQKKYAGVPMFEKVFVQMALDMNASGLISIDEAVAASTHAQSMSSDKDIEYDMEDGLLGNDPTPASFYLLDFDELFADVSNESKEYLGYDWKNDQRSFLKSFYKRMKDFTKTTKCIG